MPKSALLIITMWLRGVLSTQCEPQNKTIPEYELDIPIPKFYILRPKGFGLKFPTFIKSGREGLSMLDPFESLETRAEHDRLCTEEHHTYFVVDPPMPIPEHEVHYPWGLSLRFPASKEELAVEIYYSLTDKIVYPEISNSTVFGMLTKSYDGKYWVYSDLLLTIRPRADLSYWLSLYVTNGTHFKFIHQNYELIADNFNKPNGIAVGGFFEPHRTNDKILSKEGDLLERYSGFRKFRY